MFSSLSSSLRTTSEPHTSLPETICWYLSLGLLFIIIAIHVVIVKLCTEYAYVVYKSRVLTRIVTHYRIIVFSREIAFIICSVPELIRRRCWCSDSKKYCIPSAKTTQTIFLFFFVIFWVACQCLLCDDEFISNFSILSCGCWHRSLMRGLGGFFIRRRMDRVAGRRDHIYRAILQTVSFTTALFRGCVYLSLSLVW